MLSPMGQIAIYCLWNVLFWAICQADDNPWVGDAECWKGRYTFDSCCGDSQQLYRFGYGFSGNPKCWDEAEGFTFARCCLGGLPREEALLLRMRGRVESPLKSFFSAEFPDYDCRQAADPPTDRTLRILRETGVTCECLDEPGQSDGVLEASKSGFWSSFQARMEKTKTQLATSTTTGNCCITLQMLFIFGRLEASLSLCPLGVASAAALSLLDALTTVEAVYAVERYEILLRVIMEKFRLTTLMLSRWPILLFLTAVEDGRVTLPLESKYIVSYRFPLDETDMPRLLALRQDLGSVDALPSFDIRSIMLTGLALPSDVWSVIARHTLRAVHYLVREGANPIALVTHAYGAEYASLVPAYAARLQALTLDSVLLVCGDESTWRACNEHWWPSTELCIRADASHKQGLKFAVPAFIQHAGLEVFFFNFDAVMLQDPRSYLRKHHANNDVAYTRNTYCFYLRPSRSAEGWIRHLLRYLYDHSAYVLDMWAMNTFARHDEADAMNLPYLPIGVLPHLNWAILDEMRFAQNIPGWDCGRHQPHEIFLLHLHSGYGIKRPEEGVDMWPGTTMSNVTKLLSNEQGRREAALQVFCNKALALAGQPSVLKGPLPYMQHAPLV